MLVVSSAEQQGVITYVLRDQRGAVVVVIGYCPIYGLLRADSILIVGIRDRVCIIGRACKLSAVPRHRVTTDYHLHHNGLLPRCNSPTDPAITSALPHPPTGSSIDFNWIAIQIIRPLRPVKVDAVLSRSNRVPRFQFC